MFKFKLENGFVVVIVMEDEFLDEDMVDVYDLCNEYEFFFICCVIIFLVDFFFGVEEEKMVV